MIEDKVRDKVRGSLIDLSLDSVEYFGIRYLRIKKEYESSPAKDRFSDDFEADWIAHQMRDKYDYKTIFD